MEPSELEKNLGELEEKMERVRALYEQYFVGIEKIEPQIPRKDVDRIIAQMRKEQIRNTAMRFKFQTLVQRYNTMQQHWGRTMREIENGTFRRDVLKAAARFGEEALTGVSKRQAEKLKKAIEAQKERLGSRQQRRGKQDSIVEELSASDVELLDEFDDDAPTPPPQVAEGAPQGPGAYPGYDPYAGQQGYDPAAYAQVGYPQHYGQGQPAYDPAAYGYGHQGQPYDPHAHAAYASPPYDPTYGAHPPAYAQQGYAPAASTPQGSASRGSPQGFAIDPLAYVDDAPNEPHSNSSGGAPNEPVKKKGGLRWGGLGSRRADPEALKRIASLAGGEGPAETSAEAPAQPAAPPTRGVGPQPGGTGGTPPQGVSQAASPPARRPLLSSPIDLGLSDEEEPAPRPPPSQRKPLLSGPLDLDLGNEPPSPTTARSAAPPKPAPVPTAPSATSPAATPGPATPAAGTQAAATQAAATRAAATQAAATQAESPAPASARPASPAARPPAAAPTSERPMVRPQLRPPPSADGGAARPAPPKSARGHEFGDLNDGRLREIYGQYVQARRDRNESTAGITFEKLADSLRSQADKLKGKHGSKRVDYEVVVKDGKTLIKPIVK
jgi:hypothetical protein